MYVPRYISLPNDVYRNAVNISKSYYAMLWRRHEIEDEIISASHAPDGQPGGGGPGDPTGRKAERIIQRQAENERKIKAVEQACHLLTLGHQNKVVNSYMAGINDGDDRQFTDSFGKPKEMYLANWYMDELFGEQKILKPSLLLSAFGLSILMILAIGGIL